MIYQNSIFLNGGRVSALRSPRALRQRGVSLIEMVIATFVLSVVMLAVTTLFDSARRISTSQVALGQVQQMQRVSHQQLKIAVRTAGRGGLPAGFLAGSTAADGVALAVRTAAETPAEFMTPFTLGDEITTEILGGTDILTIRGVLTNPIYAINSELPSHFTVDTSDPTQISGTLEIFREPTPTTPLGNDLSDLEEFVAEAVPIPLILVSARSESVYAVVELDAAATNLSSEPAVIGFKATGGVHTDDYVQLSPAGPAGVPVYPVDLEVVGFAAILEEEQYYVRAAREIPGDPDSRTAPRLAIANFLAGTDTFLESEDLADNVLDLQIALGFDLDGDGIIVEEVLEEDRDEDEWLFNHIDDDPIAVDDDGATGLANAATFAYVRVSTIGITDRPELNHIAPRLTILEDHFYDNETGVALSPFNLEPENHYRKTLRVSLIDLRNLQ